MGKKKILYVITKSVWGGAQRYVFDLAANLPREEFEIAVAAGGSGPLFDKLQSAGIRAINVPEFQRDLNLPKEFKVLFALYKIFRREKPDVIHLNSSKAGGLGALAAWLYKMTSCRPAVTNLISRKLPVIIFTVHGWGFREERPFWQKAAILFLSRLGAVFQNKIILINNSDFDAARKFLPRRKLNLIFNGIEPVRFLAREEAREFFSQKIGRRIANDTVLIGAVAEFTKNKGLNYLVESLPRKQNTFGLMVGSGEEKENLQKRIAALGLEKRAAICDFIPDAGKYLKAFDIFVLPSLKEGLPYIIMEAMASGLAVISSRVGGLPDLIEPEKNGVLVPAKDAGALREAMRRLAADKKLREELGKNAQNFMQNNFKLSRMLENTINLYYETA